MPGPQVDFLAFATAAGANVEAPAVWAADPTVGPGFAAGLAKSIQVNTAHRQATFIAAVIANFISQQLNASVLDDGNLAGKITQLENALAVLIGNTSGNFYEWAGSPNGNVAGRAGVVGVNPPDLCADITNKILYFCTTTGNAATAVWSPVTGTPTVFSGTVVGGTANAVTVPNTVPTGFTLTQNFAIAFTPTIDNTGATTLNVAGTGVIACRKDVGGVLTAFAGGEFVIGIPVSLTYNGTYWVLNVGNLGTLAFLNIGNGLRQDGAGNLQANQLVVAGVTSLIAAGDHETDKVNAAAANYTLPLTTGLWSGFEFSGYAKGGTVTLTPNAADSINGAAVGTALLIGQGNFFDVKTDANGNWLVSISYGQSPQPGTLTAGTPYTNATLPAMGVYSQAHGLGAVPNQIEVRLTCTSPDSGYIVGQVIILPALYDNGGGQSGFAVYADNVKIYFATGGTYPISNGTTGGAGNLTPANWSISVTPLKRN